MEGRCAQLRHDPRLHRCVTDAHAAGEADPLLAGVA
jgi:hypothetical protein